MKLMMYLRNDLIEAVPLQKESLHQPGYLGRFKRTLKLKYSDLIKECPEPPEFLVINPLPAVSTAQVNTIIRSIQQTLQPPNPGAQ